MSLNGAQERMAWGLLAVVCAALAVLVGSCTQQGAGETQSDRTTAGIQVFWESTAQVNDTCRGFGLTGTGEFNGCARSKPGNSTVCEIYATEPRNFEDAEALQVLGHEVLHCLGATHPG